MILHIKYSLTLRAHAFFSAVAPLRAVAWYSFLTSLLRTPYVLRSLCAAAAQLTHKFFTRYARHCRAPHLLRPYTNCLYCK